eukprot:COSAG01_NODE_33812_length_558_cov_0.871460_1_plen_136_part_10
MDINVVTDMPFFLCFNFDNTPYMSPKLNFSTPLTKEKKKKKKKKKEKEKKIRQFGYTFFDNYTPDKSFDSNIEDNYILLAKDEITITIWGKINEVNTIVLDQDGKIYLPNLGPVYLNGLTINGAKKLIAAKLNKKF